MARVHPEVYFFGGGIAEGRADMRDLLGGKGAGLAEMAALKLPVPPGFTISTRVCTYYYEHNHKYPKRLDAGVNKSIARIEKAIGRRFRTPGGSSPPARSRGPCRPRATRDRARRRSQGA